MNNTNNYGKSTTNSDEVVEDTPHFLSPSVLCQRPPNQYSVSVCDQPVKCLMRSSNKCEVNEKFKCTSSWINGYIPNSSEFRRSRTSFEVYDTSRTTIASRIFDSNKNRSIYAVYDGGIMRCKTPSHVIFTIRLVRLSQNANISLVDVQRRRGCPILFRNEYQALFHAAVHGEISPCKDPRSMTYLGDIDCKQIDYVPLEESDIERSLKAASIDIESKIYDACVVTLQDLSATTDPLSKETSPTACKLILEKYCRIFEYIVDDITKEVDYNGSNKHDYNSKVYLHSLTLNLLGNILMAVPKHSTLTLLVQDRQRIISIIKSLLRYVGMAKECPINASLAAKCLRLFVSVSPDAIFMFDTNTDITLENARRFGELTYSNLEKEAQAALTAINV